MAKESTKDSDEKFPYDTSFMQFAAYSADSTFGTNILSKKDMKSIILGGYWHCRDGFYDVLLNHKTNRITFKSFIKDHHKTNANLREIGLEREAICTHCFMTRNNEYIIVFKLNVLYNVYDMKKDIWVLPIGTCKFNFDGDHSRSILLDDKIIIISTGREIYFYSIANDISNPVMITTYTMELKNSSEETKYSNHGMCLYEYTKEDFTRSNARGGTGDMDNFSMNSNINTNRDGNMILDKSVINLNVNEKCVYRFKLLVFGGQRNFWDTMTTLDVSLSLSYENVVININGDNNDNVISTNNNDNDSSSNYNGDNDKDKDENTGQKRQAVIKLVTITETPMVIDGSISK